MNPARLGADRWNPLKSIEAMAVADLLSGGESQKKPRYLQMSGPTHEAVIPNGSDVMVNLKFWIMG